MAHHFVRLAGIAGGNDRDGMPARNHGPGQHLYDESDVDGGLLVSFGGLFIVMGAIEPIGLSSQQFAVARPVAEGGVARMAAVSAVLSNLVS